MNENIVKIKFGSPGDPDHHHPSHVFMPQEDITPKEAALCAMVVSRMENNHSDFTSTLNELGVIRHFIKIER